MEIVHGFANSDHRRDYRHRVLEICSAAEFLNRPTGVAAAAGIALIDTVGISPGSLLVHYRSA